MATKKERAQAKSTVKFWLRKIDKATVTLKEFKDEAEKAYKAAHDTDDELKHSFNIHWSSCAIIRSAIYASRPKPDVRRRYQKPDPEEKELARLVERAIEYQLDVYNFEEESGNVVRDYVEVGLGVPRLIYEVKKQPQMDELGEPVILDDGPAEEITSQCVKVEHTPWSQFLWEPGKAWKDVDWVGFKSFKSKKDIKDDFDVELSGGKDDETKLKADEYEEMATVWEIWHRPSKTIYVICPNHPEAPLDEYPDGLGLSDFFPCPQPLMANVKYDELIPKPDYCFIESQIRQINRLATRIYELSAQIKDVSLYDSAMKGELATLYSKSDGAMVPVVGLAATMQAIGGSSGGKGWDGAVISAPMDRKIQVIRELQAQLTEAKEQLYEVYGISDIVRGATKASETLGAQQLKSQYANVRLNEKQGGVAMLWRNFFRMMAEIICERFDDMQLFLMTGIEVTERMREIMDNDIGRSFAIDVETDSTIMQDDAENRQQTMEMIDTLIQRLETLIPAVQSGALPIPFAQETLRLLIGQFKHGKNLEDAIEEIGPHLEGLQNFQQQMQQMQEQLNQAMQQGQQLAEQNEQLQKQVQQFNERKEAREDRKVQLDEVETSSKLRDTDVDNAREAMEAEADVDKTQAETMKIIREATEPRVIGM